MNNNYEIIRSFFDCYGLAHAHAILEKTIKTADAKKVWEGPCPANVLHFTKRLKQLIEAAFSIMEQYDFRSEVVIEDKNNEEIWLLMQYEIYCGWHIHSTPWDFFPRHLSKKEFLDPYKALKKFMRYQSITAWKAVLKDILEHALSPHSIAEFDNGTGILATWLHLHKLIEAAHLIEVRVGDEDIRPRRKWKGPETLSVTQNNEIEIDNNTETNQKE